MLAKIIWLFWQFNSYCSLHMSNDVFWLCFLTYATFCFSWFCEHFFFYLLSLPCQLTFNSFHVLFEIYVIWLNVIFQLPKSIYWSPLHSPFSHGDLPLNWWFSRSCYTVVSHPGTGVHHSSVFSSLFPVSFAFCSLLVCSFVLLEHI